MPKPLKTKAKARQVKPMLAGNNTLVCLESGVWVDANDQQREFIGYTDGDAAENAVYVEVEKATDRSVESYELDALRDNWALEYHLGSKRANIYRGLNLAGVKRVLEVGCGCGAITRFLGEHGFQVDAIEGTLRRAQIARLRTADLLNVQLISSNYHQLKLPENAYDLIVFTGVLEYSGAYAQEGISPEAQLAQTLASAQRALASDGVILVAIENRTGFKYIAGASEDHLNVPNIGLLNYPEPQSGSLTRGIRTWSKTQWSNMLSDIEGCAQHAFCYPFPDYKIPEVILSDQFLENALHPAEVLNGVKSRDYFKQWRPKLPESVFWKTAAQTDSLGQFANSFLIVIAKEIDRLSEIIDFDFVRFPNSRRKREHRYLIKKAKDNAHVERLGGGMKSDTGPVKSAGLKKEAFVDGQILQQQWLDRLTVTPNFIELGSLITQYHNWLVTQFSNASSPALLIDALPQNVVVTDEGQWHLIDKEWEATTPISCDLVFFRAVLYLGLSARDELVRLSLTDMQGGFPDETPPAMPDNLGEFIRWCFEVVQVPISESQYQEYIDWESAMQQQVVRDTHTVALREVLEAPLGRSSNPGLVIDLHPVEARIFWTQVDGVWHIDHSATGAYQENNGLTANITLPPAIATHPFVQINPAHYRLQSCNGWMEFDSLSLEEIDQDSQNKVVFSIASAQELLSLSRLENMMVSKQNTFIFTGLEPKLTLNLSKVSWSENCQGAKLVFSLKAPLVQDYPNNYQALVSEDAHLAQRISGRQQLLNIQAQRIASSTQKLASLEKQLSELTPAVAPTVWEKLKNRWV